jgi:hypothetical protein
VVAEECVIVIFPSTHQALKAERVAGSNGLDVKMIPVPRDISSDCNVGMKISTEDEETAKALFGSSNVRCEFVPWPKKNA